MSDVFSIVSIVIMIACLTWSVGVLIFALIKKAILKRKAKKLKKEVLNDGDQTNS